MLVFSSPLKDKVLTDSGCEVVVVVVAFFVFLIVWMMLEFCGSDA